MIVPLCLSHQTGAWAPILDLLNKEMTASYNHHVMCLRQMYQHRRQKIQDRWSKTRLSSATVWWKTQQVTQRTGNKHHLCDWGRKSPAGAESDSQSSIITVLDLIKPQETQSFFSFRQMLRQRLHVERNEQCVWVNWSRTSRADHGMLRLLLDSRWRLDRRTKTGKNVNLHAWMWMQTKQRKRLKCKN